MVFMASPYKNVVSDIISHPLVSNITSPDFLSKGFDEQIRVYNSIPTFRASNVSFDKMLEISKDYYHTSSRFISSSLQKNIETILAEQSSDGSWYFADPGYLLSLKKDLSQSLENLLKLTNTDRPATPWVNALIIILLKKWRDFLLSMEDKKTIAEPLENSIEKASNWLKNQILYEDRTNLSGWTFLKPLTGSVCTFETSMSLIALNYHNSGFGFIGNTDSSFYGKEQLDCLLNESLREDDGSWKTEACGSVDTGATSYALLCLLKYCEICFDRNIEELHVPIMKGIEWLAINQRVDGGWGDKNKNDSNSSFVEKTCYALMAISKYQNHFDDDYSLNLKNGIGFLRMALSTFSDFPEKYAWPNDYSKSQSPEPSLKYSSLAISSMLRCGVPYYDFELKKSLMGLIRVYEDIKNDPRTTWEDKIYYFCMLSDYLRVLE